MKQKKLLILDVYLFSFTYCIHNIKNNTSFLKESFSFDIVSFDFV